MLSFFTCTLILFLTFSLFAVTQHESARAGGGGGGGEEGDNFNKLCLCNTMCNVESPRKLGRSSRFFRRHSCSNVKLGGFFCSFSEKISSVQIPGRILSLSKQALLDLLPPVKCHTCGVQLGFQNRNSYPYSVLFLYSHLKFWPIWLQYDKKKSVFSCLCMLSFSFKILLRCYLFSLCINSINKNKQKTLSFDYQN